MAGENIERLAQEFLDHVKTLTAPNSGKPYGAATITQWTAALAGFIRAMKNAGISDVRKLPENFLLTYWLKSQDDQWDQKIRMRIRASGVSQFAIWLRNRIPEMPPLRSISITKDFNPIEMLRHPDRSAVDVEDLAQNIPPPKPKTLPEFLQENPMSQNDDLPVPAEPPRLVPPPIPQASQERVEAASPIMALPAPKRVSAAMAKSGLAALLPSNAHRLRARLEREGKDPLFLYDYAESQVMSYGTIEAFLVSQAIKRVPPGDLSGDTLKFRVCIVDPRGAEGQANLYEIAVPPELRAGKDREPAPQPQAQQPQAPFNPMSLLDDLKDLSDRDREKGEEFIERAAARLRQTQPAQRQQPWPPPHMQPQQPSGNAQIDRLGEGINKLANIMLETNERINRLEHGRSQLQQAPQPMTMIGNGGSTSDVLLPLLMKLLDRQLAPPIAPPALTNPLDTLKELMVLARPQHIETDTSNLEDQIDDLKKQIADNNPLKMLSQLKEMKEFFRPGGLLSSEGDRPSSGLLGGLRDLMGMVFDHTGEIQKIAEGVINTMAAAKVQAITQAMVAQRQLAQPAPGHVEVQQRSSPAAAATPASTTEPTGERRAEGPPASTPVAPVEKKELPKEINDKIAELLTATSPDLMVVLTYDLMQLMSNFEPTQEVVQKVMKYLEDDKLPHLVIYMRDVFAQLGYGEVATAARIQTIVDAIQTQIEKAKKEEEAKEAAAAAASGGDGTGPDEVSDDEIEEEEEIEEENGDEGAEGGDEEVEEEEPEASGAPIVIHTTGTVVSVPEEEEQPRG